MKFVHHSQPRKSHNLIGVVKLESYKVVTIEKVVIKYQHSVRKCRVGKNYIVNGRSMKLVQGSSNVLVVRFHKKTLTDMAPMSRRLGYSFH